MKDTNFERNSPLIIRPEFVPAEQDAVDHRFALSLLNFYHYNPALYKSHMRAVLMADKALSRKIAERRSQAKQTPNTAGDWDDPTSAMLPGPWTLVGSVALGVVAWAVWGIVKMLKP